MADETGVEKAETPKASKKIESAARVLASPEHPSYSADRAVSVNFAGGKSSIIAAIDGVGSGGKKSSEAANFVARHLREVATQFIQPPTTKEAIVALKNAIFQARNEVQELQSKTGDSQVDTTVSAAVFCKSPIENDDNPCLVIAHVGNSSIYRYSPTIGTLSKLTRDDTLAQGLVDAGVIDREDESEHPGRKVLLRTVGKLRAPREINTDTIRVRDGEIFLAVSDGVSENLRGLNTAVRDEYQKAYDPTKKKTDLKKFADGIAERAQNVQKQGTAEYAKPDDTTVAVMKVPRGFSF